MKAPDSPDLRVRKRVSRWSSDGAFKFDGIRGDSAILTPLRSQRLQRSLSNPVGAKGILKNLGEPEVNFPAPMGCAIGRTVEFVKADPRFP